MRNGNIRIALREIFGEGSARRTTLPVRERSLDGLSLIRKSSEKIADDAVTEFVRVLEAR